MGDGAMTGNDEVRVDLLNDEILQGSSKIAVRFREDIDTDAVASAIEVEGTQGAIVGAIIPDAPGGLLWEALSPIPPGWHRFVVKELPDVSPRIEIPFFVVAARAEWPLWARVQSFSRLRLESDGFERIAPDQVPDGEFVDILKVVNRDDGMPFSLGFNQSGEPVDGELILREHRDRLLRARGKLDPALEEQLSPPEPVRDLLIDAWFRIELPEPVGSENGDVESPQRSDSDLTLRIRERAREIFGQLSQSLAPGILDLMNPEDHAPVLTLRVLSDAVRAIAAHESIEVIFLHEQHGIPDLTESIRIARSDLVHGTGQTGVGVRVAVWEDSPDLTENLAVDLASAYDPLATIRSIHSTVVHDIIRNKGVSLPAGHAPGCDLLAANSMDRKALRWAIDTAQCSIINQSFHRRPEAHSATPSGDDRYSDWRASQPPYPLIVQAAGNMDAEDGVEPRSNEYVNHKGYNTFVVANHSDDALTVNPKSVRRNPSTLHGDRELPDISANGCTINAEGFVMEGTSFAAPAVSGVASLLQATDGVLKTWPEGCRAILLASAGPRVSGTRWWQDVVAYVDAADGAGALNAQEAVEVAKCRTAKDAAPTRRGWDVALLQARDFDATRRSVFSYRLTVPLDAGPGLAQVRAVIAWASRTANPGDPWSSLDVDLDLEVFDSRNVRVGFSGSFDNSHEVVQFGGVPGQTYSIRVLSSAPHLSTRCGVAWTAGGSFVSLPRP